MKLLLTLPIAIISLSFLLAILVYPQYLPLVASHWGVDGQVNGYSPKAVGLFLMPMLSVFLYGLFRFLPSVDPYKKNFQEFKNYFDSFVVVIFAFLFYLYLLTIFWNLGWRFNMIQLLSPAFAILFYFASILTGNARRNWFVGIRTPWTLSSKIVWQKTHFLGAKLFKFVALLTLLGTIFPQFAFYLLLVPIISTTIFIFAYSYWLFRQEHL